MRRGWRRTRARGPVGAAPWARTLQAQTAAAAKAQVFASAARPGGRAPATAMPTSAFLSAGASLTPSPVIATMWCRRCSMATISYLCSGNTSAKPSASSTNCSAGLSMPSWPVLFTCCAHAARASAPRPEKLLASLRAALPPAPQSAGAGAVPALVSYTAGDSRRRHWHDTETMCPHIAPNTIVQHH